MLILPASKQLGFYNLDFQELGFFEHLKLKNNMEKKITLISLTILIGDHNVTYNILERELSYPSSELEWGCLHFA